jgi:hypothetical protein
MGMKSVLYSVFFSSYNLENVKQIERVIFVVWSDQDRKVYE